MLNASPLMAFVATARPEAALAFYGTVLGLPLLEDTPFALVFDAHGTRLRVQKVQQVVVAPYTVLGWRVPDIRAAVQALAAKGVEFRRYPGIDQDELGIWMAPGNTQVAWFRDPDGHTLSLSTGP
jgi:catechol 2,3-dioxygenase-like lactoylglutathione lyase family enzyme